MQRSKTCEKQLQLWETLIAKLHPAALLLTAAEHRLERANALLRSAIEGNNHAP
jgi:hypothetical protein